MDALCEMLSTCHLGNDLVSEMVDLPYGVRNYLNLLDLDDLVDEYKTSNRVLQTRCDSGDMSENEYECSAYDSECYGILENIIDTESEEEEDDTVHVDSTSSMLSRPGTLLPGPSVW